MPRPFIDTNIFLRHVTGQPAQQAQKATKFLQQIEERTIHAETSEIVIFKVVFTLERAYKQSKRQIKDAVLPLLMLPYLHLVGKHCLKKTFELYVNRNIPFADAYIVEFMKYKKLGEIISFDHDFDKISELKRKEP